MSVSIKCCRTIHTPRGPPARIVAPFAQAHLHDFMDNRSLIENDTHLDYWEVIADNLSKAGWSWNCVSGVDSNGRTIWIADAHRGNGKRYVVRADEKLIAFLELKLRLEEFGNSVVQKIINRGPAGADVRATRKLENAAIREAVLQAVAEEQRKSEFRLFGRGHEPRVSLRVSVAAVLRGLDIPRVYISGFGANYFYPTRVFAAAIRILKKKWGRSPIVIGHRVYRI